METVCYYNHHATEPTRYKHPSSSSLGMTAPEQPVGGAESTSQSQSQSPTEPVTKHHQDHGAAKGADVVTGTEPLTTKQAPVEPLEEAQRKVQAPSTDSILPKPASQSPRPTTPPAQTGSNMLGGLALAAAAAKNSRDDSETATQQDHDNMSASVLTIRPPKKDSDISTQYLTPQPSSYVDPTPATPMTSQPPSRSPSTAARSLRSDGSSPTRIGSGPDNDDKPYTSEEEQDGGSEIQSIMEQFSESGGGPDADEVMSPRLEITSPIFGGGPLLHQHPPRKSSLEPLSTSFASPAHDAATNSNSVSAAAAAAPTATTTANDEVADDQGPPVPPKDGAFGTPPRKREQRGASTSLASPTSPQLSMHHRPPPPEPEPEPVLPFDFHRFLEQLRNKKADPVARYLKSFLTEFAKRQWMVHEQVKIISDFLAFIANKMMLCEVWRDVSDAEFDNAREGMEKLVMNRLYSQTFSPAIPPPKPVPGAKPRKRGGEAPLGPGRRGQHQEDVERDDIVTQKINIYGWIKPEHLDIPAIEDSGRRFLKLAQQGAYWLHFFY